LEIPARGKLSYVEPGAGTYENCLKKGELNKREGKRYYHFIARWVASTQFMADVSGQFLEARRAECGKLLASLVSSRMESCLSGEEAREKGG
jgi:hypothetical protein